MTQPSQAPAQDTRRTLCDWCDAEATHIFDAPSARSMRPPTDNPWREFACEEHFDEHGPRSAEYARIVGWPS